MIPGIGFHTADITEKNRLTAVPTVIRISSSVMLMCMLLLCLLYRMHVAVTKMIKRASAYENSKTGAEMGHFKKKI